MHRLLVAFTSQWETCRQTAEELKEAISAAGKIPASMDDLKTSRLGALVQKISKFSNLQPVPEHNLQDCAAVAKCVRNFNFDFD